MQAAGRQFRIRGRKFRQSVKCSDLGPAPSSPSVPRRLDRPAGRRAARADLSPLADLCPPSVSCRRGDREADHGCLAWIGECSERLADGPGTLQWQMYGDHFEASGLIRKGRLEGLWTQRSSRGAVTEWHYVDGRAHGPASSYGGNRFEKGQYRIGRKEGLWTVYFKNDDGPPRGTRTEMYVDGLEHGRSVSRDADGSI